MDILKTELYTKREMKVTVVLLIHVYVNFGIKLCCFQGYEKQYFQKNRYAPVSATLRLVYI